VSDKPKEKQARVRDVIGSMATFTAVWGAIDNQRKKQDDYDIRIEYFEKRLKSIEAKLGEQLYTKKTPIVEAIGKEVA